MRTLAAALALTCGVHPAVSAETHPPASEAEPALSTTLQNPLGIAYDGKSALYVAERRGNRVRKIDLESGLITTIAGTGDPGDSGDGGPAVAARLAGPTYLWHAPGRLIISDTRNQRIREVDLSRGTISTIVGTGEGGYGGDGASAARARIRGPYGLIIDRRGNLVFADTDNDRIRSVDGKTGVISTIAGNGERGFSGDGGPALEASLSRPHVLAELPNGDLIIGDSFNHRIRWIDRATGRIESIAGDGNEGKSPPSTPGADARFMYFGEIRADEKSRLLITEWGNDRIIRLEGDELRISEAIASPVASPAGLALDGDGFFFVEAGGGGRCGRVHRAGPDGRVTTVAGTESCQEDG